MDKNGKCPTCGQLVKSSSVCDGNCEIQQSYMKSSEFIQNTGKPTSICLHHTAGWNDPFRTIKNWERDSRGRVGTEFVIGGINIKNGDEAHDGKIVQAFPAGNNAWHLGACTRTAHLSCVGIEICNFGGLKEKKTWTGVVVPDSMISKTGLFRGYGSFHKYTDKQLESLKNLLIYIGERDGIDIRAGLPALIKEKGKSAFNIDKSLLKQKHLHGIISHTNVRSGKSDVSPQQELMDMLVSL